VKFDIDKMKKTLNLKITFALVLMIGVLACSYTPKKKVPSYLKGYEDERYGDEELNVFNVWVPEGSESAPFFIWWHGGGFTHGSHTGLTELAELLIDQGIGFMNVGYTLDGNPYTAFGEAEQFIDYIKANASKYNLDVNKLFLGGGSAGQAIVHYLVYREQIDGVRGVWFRQVATPSPSVSTIKSAGPIPLIAVMSDLYPEDDDVHSPLKAFEWAENTNLAGAEGIYVGGASPDAKEHPQEVFLYDQTPDGGTYVECAINGEWVKKDGNIISQHELKNPGEWIWDILAPIPPSRATSAIAFAEGSGVECDLFNIEEILDESTLDIEILKDWHVDEVTGSTRQKLIEINVAEWWPGQDYRIPVRMIVPLKGKAKGFSITGANEYETLMKDSQPDDFQAKLLANGVGIVKTHVKRVAKIPGKKGQLEEMEKLFKEDPNPRYTQVWIWTMTLMRAATAAYADVDHFEKGKVAGSGSSKNGISPAVALINDERFTATCSNHAFAYYSPSRRKDREVMAKAAEANKAFFEAVEAGDVDLDQERTKLYQRVMVGKAGRSQDTSQDTIRRYADCFWPSVSVTENWDRLMERDVDILFTPGTHDYVAYDIVWGAQNHPPLPVYYNPGGGHSQTPHVAAAKDEENLSAFLWHHFFGGEPLLKPPTSSHKVDEDKLSVSVRFKEGPQPISGRIWWIYDRAPAGSAPFLHVPIPEGQWAAMERDPKTGSWTATIPLQEGASRIDFFSNHGHMANGYQQYLSSPYTRVELSQKIQRLAASNRYPANRGLPGSGAGNAAETKGNSVISISKSRRVTSCKPSPVSLAGSTLDYPLVKTGAYGADGLKGDDQKGQLNFLSTN